MPQSKRCCPKQERACFERPLLLGRRWLLDTCADEGDGVAFEAEPALVFAIEKQTYRWLTSQQAGARVLLENFRVVDVAAQRLDRPVA